MLNEATKTPSSPLSLIAELTHRCPLHCLYCSNPLTLKGADDELSAEEWRRVFREAAALGVVQLHLTGGEPLARKDLAELVSAVREAGLYLNLITSGIGLTEDRMAKLVDAGLDHLQLSFQDVDEASADEIAGTRAHAHKLRLAPVVKRFPVALTINLVVHRMNLDRLEEFIRLAEQFEPERLEIAHVQYYGWALQNRSLLMPTRPQVERSVVVIEAARARLAGKIRLESVMPDYYANFPKPCVGGWGRQMMLIDPTGQALPCHAAAVIPELKFDNVRDRDLAWIWQASPAFTRFRGEEWMAEPCRSCTRRELDFGGCRCQAFLLTGRADATDPACGLSPDHGLVELARRAPDAPLLPQWRPSPQSCG